jgi:enoyl-CoA hydratase/carnithine racemase
VVPADELESTARAYAERLAGLPQEHLRTTLRMLRKVQPQPSDELLDAGEDAHRWLFQQADTATAAAAFASRQRSAALTKDGAVN